MNSILHSYPFGLFKSCNFLHLLEIANLSLPTVGGPSPRKSTDPGAVQQSCGIEAPRNQREETKRKETQRKVGSRTEKNVCLKSSITKRGIYPNLKNTFTTLLSVMLR